MKNITKLKCWNELQVLGFTKITFSFHGKVQTVGATNGKITIEPHNYNHTNKCYHISGHSNNPITRKLYRYNYIGTKEEIYINDTFINDFFAANQILTTIKELNN